LSPNNKRFNQRFLSPDMAQLILLPRPIIGGRSVHEESGETTGEFRIDLERVIVDPDYRRRVLLRLRAETEASVPPLATAPSHKG
jgi:hypothetical protein